MIAPASPPAIERFTFDRLLTGLLFLTIATSASLMPAQNDTWWQLRAGREMWRTHGVLLHDTFSHTAVGSFWPNHEWLSQAIFYAIYSVGGLPLLTVFSAAVVVAAWTIVWRLTRGTPRSRFLLVAFVLAAASGGWSPRPQVLSLVLTMATIALLRARRYMWLPAVFLLWANLHGAVLLGVWLLAAALPAAYIEDRAASRRLGVAAAASAAATFVTPLGVHFWVDIVASLGRIRQLGIAEWAPPQLADLPLLPFWIVIVGLPYLAIRRGPSLLRDPDALAEGRVTLCACAVALMPLALSASRNVPLFLMAAVPAVAALLPRNTLDSRRLSRERPLMNAGLAAAAASLAVTGVAVSYARSVPHLAWRPLPDSSLTALRGCSGNLYNRYDEGGYLIWFAPDRKVFLDGRQDPYSPALIAEQKHVESTGDFAPTFGRYGIGCAYVPAESIVARRLLDSGWTPLYKDARWAVLTTK